MTVASTSTGSAGTTTPRRVPLVVAADAADSYGLEEKVWKELLATVESESLAFRRTGKLREEDPEAATSPERLTLVKKPPPPPPTAPREKPSFLLGLRKLYQAMSDNGESAPTTAYHGLLLLQRAALCRDSRLLWEAETPLEARIKQRNEAADRESKEKTVRARALLESQKPATDEHGEFNKYYQQSQDDMRLAAARDQAALEEIERRAAREVSLGERRKEALREQADARKAAAGKAREERTAARKKQLEDLARQDEEMRDNVDAAFRVRAKWESAKAEYMKTNDEAKLDNY